MKVTISLSEAQPVNETVTITATVEPAAQAAEVTSVQFLIDGVVKGTDTTSPYTYSWDTTTYFDGPHTIVAKAFYPRNKVSQGQLPGVQVLNNPSTPPPPPPPPQGVPVIQTVPSVSDTTPQEGQLISTDSGIWTNNPTKFYWQWLACDGAGDNCVSIPAAVTYQYTVGGDDVGDRLRVQVIAENTAGLSAPARSAATTAVSALAAAVPTNTAAPYITGNAVENSTLSVSNGSWTNSPTDYDWQWRRCDTAGANCVNVGVNAPSYSLTSSDVGKTIRCNVTASNASGSSTPKESAQTAVVTSASTPPPPPSPPAILSTGFEAATTLDPLTDPPHSQPLYFHGTDATTGFNWDSARFYGSPEPWHISSIVGNPSGSISSYMAAAIETVTGPTGASTKALKIGLLGASGAPGGQQIFLDTNSMTQAIKDYYLRAWVKFDPSVATRAAAAGSNYWRMFWEFKTWTDYRMKLMLQNHYAGGPTWAFEVDNGGWQAPGTLVYYWNLDSQNSPGGPFKVPLNQWFHMEIYLHRSTGSDGRFFFSVNGQKIFERFGPNYGARNDEIAILAHSIMYGAPSIPGYQHIESLEVRALPPCGTLPCGSSTSSSPPPEPPPAPEGYQGTVLTDSPTAYWRMNESSGLIRDISANVLHATATTGAGSLTYQQTGALASDPNNKAIKFNPNIGFSIPANAVLNFGDVFTLECWVKRNVSGEGECLFSKGTGNFALYITAGNTVRLTKEGTSIIVDSTTSITADGQFHHVVVTKSGATVKIYIDGSDVTGSVSNATIVNTTSTNLLLGAEQAGFEYLNGWMDEVAVYATALSATRVQAHYAAR